MLTVTTRARAALYELLDLTLGEDAHLELGAVDDGPSAIAFRLVSGRDRNSDFALALGRERPGDAVVEHAGRPVLRVDIACAEMLGPALIDVADTPDGAEIALCPAMEFEI
jgi:hypothetical protein